MIRLSTIIARIEDRAVVEYAKAKPVVLAKLAAAQDELLIRREAAAHARKFYAQVVAEVRASRK